MAKVYLSLGGNLGDREQNLKEALSLLRANKRIKITKLSSVYETEPVGYVDQPLFLNVVIEAETGLKPYELLEYCGSIEQLLKRERLVRWGPRTMDIDILLYDNITMDDSKLTIPHPRMREREFVMIPLMEIAPDMVLEGEKISDIAGSLNPGKVRKLEG